MQDLSSIQSKLIGLDIELRSLIASNTLETNYYTFREKLRAVKNELRTPEAQRMKLYLFEFLGGCHKVMSVDFVRKQRSVLQKWESVHKQTVGNTGNSNSDPVDELPRGSNDGKMSENVEMARNRLENASVVTREPERDTSTAAEITPQEPEKTELSTHRESPIAVESRREDVTAKEAPVTGANETRNMSDEAVPTVETLEDEDSGSDIYQPSNESRPKRTKPRNLRNRRYGGNEKEDNEMEVDEIDPDGADVADESDDVKIIRKRRKKIVEASDAQSRPTKKRRAAQATGEYNKKPCQNCAQRSIKCEKQGAGGTCVGCYRLKKKCEYAGPRGGVGGTGRRKERQKLTREIIEVTDDEQIEVITKKVTAGPSASKTGPSAAGPSASKKSIQSTGEHTSESDAEDSDREEWRKERRADKQPQRGPRRSNAVKQLDAALIKLDQLTMKYDFLLEGNNEVPGINQLPKLLDKLWDRMDKMENHVNRLGTIQNNIIRFLNRIQTVAIGERGNITAHVSPKNPEDTMVPTPSHSQDNSEPPKPISRNEKGNGRTEFVDVEMVDETEQPPQGAVAAATGADKVVNMHTVHNSVVEVETIIREPSSQLVQGVAVDTVMDESSGQVDLHAAPDADVHAAPDAEIHADLHVNTIAVPVPPPDVSTIILSAHNPPADANSSNSVTDNHTDVNPAPVSIHPAAIVHLGIATPSSKLAGDNSQTLDISSHTVSIKEANGSGTDPTAMEIDTDNQPKVPIPQTLSTLPNVVLTPPTPATSQEVVIESRTLLPPMNTSTRRSPRIRARSVTPVPDSITK